MGLISGTLLLVPPQTLPQCAGPMQALTSAPQGKFTDPSLENAGQLHYHLNPPSLDYFTFLSAEAGTSPLYLLTQPDPFPDNQLVLWKAPI